MQSAGPARIATVPPAVVGKQRIKVTRSKRVPGAKSEAPIARPIKVAEEVMVMVRPEPKRTEQTVNADEEPRPVVPPWVEPIGPVKPDRSEEQTAVGERIIPVAVNINVAAARVAIV